MSIGSPYLMCFEAEGTSHLDLSKICIYSQGRQALPWGCSQVHGKICTYKGNETSRAAGGSA